MKRLLILGGGTAGTMVANKLRRKLDRAHWQITVVDQDDRHVYQPGFLFLPFGAYRPADVSKPRRQFFPDGVEFVLCEIDRVDADADEVYLADGRRLGYDYLVIASGTSPRPDQTPGMLGKLWRQSIFDFYSLDGATALAGALSRFDAGRLVVHVTDVPIKCPVAPLEFAFLADAYFRHRDMRDRVELTYATPLAGAFTKPIASAQLGSMLDERKIAVEPDFMVERIDDDTKTLISYDEREIPFDLLVTVPLNMGADYIARSGLGDELNYVPVDKHTLLSRSHQNIFAVGDANDIPTSKAGSVAHFSVDVFTGNFCQHVAGQPMTGSFDGHANCFVEAGDGKGLLIDFNYDTEPLTGSYPVPVVGPFWLLRESAANHWGKLAFRWMYWHLLLPGRPIPLPAHMSMAGKHKPDKIVPDTTGPDNIGEKP
ncbi:MAG TPA: FAD/NAD(P)-binding oxidoreductase [Streptosporangiaceae bacterium]|nr:FAD/NAD(P)-binding oxidoreductase [Streptosporangiaceae bacterium]